MPHTSRIPTPFKQHLHRFRLGVLPVIAFVLCVCFTLWLWERQSNTGQVLGEVEATVLDVTAGVAGQLVDLPQHSNWQVFDHVAKGDVIAYLDDQSAQARMKTVQAEASKLLADLDAARANFELSQTNVLQQHQREIVRLQWETERRYVEFLQLSATLNATKSELIAIKRTLTGLGRSPGLLGATGDLVQRRDTLQAQYDANEPVYNELKRQHAAAEKELNEHPELQLAEVKIALAPIEAARQVQEAVMAEVQVELDNLVIRSPIDGVISAVNHYPGQRVLAGDSIVSIAEPHSQYVISYIRPQQRIGLRKGMKVGLRLQSQPGSPEYPSLVEVVGPQVTQVPASQLTDQTVPEWATPIRIPIPPALQQRDLRPGQPIDVIFPSPRQAEK